MRRVKFKMTTFVLVVLLSLVCATQGYSVARSHQSDDLYTLSFESCAPYDSPFELDYILIDSCEKNPCQIPIGREVTITGSFTYSGSNMDKDLKLIHRPNWLLNYVYTAAIVVQNDNEFTSSNRFDFEAIVYVDEGLAPLRGTLSWRLHNEQDEKVACFNIPIQLHLC